MSSLCTQIVKGKFLNLLEYYEHLKSWSWKINTVYGICRYFNVYIYIYIYISCRAVSTYIPDHVSPLLPIVHRLWQVFKNIDNILRKNQNGFRRNRSMTSQILIIRRILECVQAKNLQATLLFVDFTQAFDSIHRGKMEQILLAYGLPKETVVAITIHYRNTKVKVRSPDGHTEYFDIVEGILQGTR